MATQDVNIIPFDYEHFADAMIYYLRITAPNDYLDFLESNSSRVLVDSISYAMGLLGFMVNVNLQQMFVPTVNTRRGMYLLGRLVNYNLSGPIPARVSVTFSIDDTHNFDILIPKGIQVSSPGSSAQIFETTDDVIILRGSTSTSVAARHGVTHTEIIGTTNTNNTPNQQFKTTRTPLYDTLQITINGIVWSQVENIFELSDRDRGYTARPDENGVAIITFGNGVFGTIPPPDQSVEISYLSGGGKQANVGAGTITEVLSTIADSNGSVVSVSVTNPSEAFGGQDEESLDEARVNIPRSVRSMGRFVSREDFKFIPSTFSDPVVGRVFKSNADVTFNWTVHHVTIYVLGEPNSSNPLHPTLTSDDLKIKLKSFVEEKTLATTTVTIKDGDFHKVDIVGNVYYLSNYREDIVQEQINSTINRIFDPSIRDMGEGLRFSDITAALDNTTGVNYVDLTSPEGNENIEPNEFIVPGDINLTLIRGFQTTS